VAKDLDTYLKELQAAMTSAGGDKALVQDALFDAEEYLRNEMAARFEGDPATVEEYRSRFATVSEAYGTPEEVAAAYLGAPAAGAAPAPAAGAATAAAPAAAVGAATPPEAPHVTPPGAPKAPVRPVHPVPPAPPVPPTPAGVAAGVAATGAAPAAGAVRPSAWRQVFGVVVDPAVYKAWLYMILSLATGIAAFTIVVTGVSVSAGCSVLLVGIPLFLLVLGIVRALSLAEGRLVEGLLGTRMPRRERAELPEAGWLKRVGYWLRDARTWASMAYMILLLPLGIAYFTIAVTGLALGFGLIASPFGAWRGDNTFWWHGTEHTWGAMPYWAMPLAVLAGVVVLLLWMHLIRLIGRGHAAFAKRMLVRLAND
jgi:hypothetical protein